MLSTAYVDILGLKMEINYLFKPYLENNLNQYQLSQSPEKFDYKITSVLKNQIIYDEKSSYIMISSTKNKQIKAAVTVKNHHYIIYLLKTAFTDLPEAEYIYMGIVFLEIALLESLFPLHASTILYQNEAIAFSAPSKTGKSTHTSLWEKYIPESVKLNDDKTIISFDKDVINAHGIPFSGAAFRNLNHGAKLKAIVFLKQAKKNCIYKIEAEQATRLLAKNIYQPKDEKQWRTILQQIQQLVLHIPIYILEANISEEAVRVVYDAIYK